MTRFVVHFTPNDPRGECESGIEDAAALGPAPCRAFFTRARHEIANPADPEHLADRATVLESLC
jgi:hypothetical protein